MGSASSHITAAQIKEQVIGAVTRGKWVIGGVVLLGLIGAILYTGWQPDQYEAASTVRLDSPASAGRKSSAEDGLQILRSSSFARQVGRELMDQPPIVESGKRLPLLRSHPPSKPARHLQEVANQLHKRITVSQVGPALLTVTVLSSHSEEAVILANTYAQEFTRHIRTGQGPETRLGLEHLRHEKNRYEERVRELTAKIRRIRTDPRAVDLNDRAAALADQIARLQSLRRKASTRLQGAQSALDQIVQDGDLSAGETPVSDLKALLERKVGSLHRKKAKLLVHKNLLSSSVETGIGSARIDEIDSQSDQTRVNRQIQDLNQRIQRGISQVMGEAQSPGQGSPNGYTPADLSRLVDHLMAIRQHKAELQVVDSYIVDYEAEVASLPPPQRRLAQLTRARTVSREAATFFSKQLQEAQGNSQVDGPTGASIVSQATQAQPVTQLPFNLSAGLIAGLLAGIGTVLVRGMHRPPIRRVEELEKLGYPVVGSIPEFRNQSTNARPPDAGGRLPAVGIKGDEADNSNPKARPFRNLQTALDSQCPDTQGCSLLVTSAQRREGRTVTALRVAAYMLQAGEPVLLVDADVQSPDLHRAIGAERGPGLVDLTLNGRSFSPARFATSIDNFYLLPAGSPTAGSSVLFAEPELDRLFASLRVYFRYIIVDGPPVSENGVRLARTAAIDSSLLVVESGKTQRATIRTSGTQLVSAGARPVGTVLNRDPASSNAGSPEGSNWFSSPLQSNEAPNRLLSRQTATGNVSVKEIVRRN